MMIPTSQEETCESKSSFLPQAVATHLSQSNSRENAKDDKDGYSNSGPDSGYGTQSPTPVDVTTPAKSRSLETTSSILQETLPEEGRRILFSRRAKAPLLKVFNKPIPLPVRNRFEDLNELYGKKLIDYLRNSKMDIGTIRKLSIKLKLVGLEEDTAKPCVVVLCDRASAKIVKQFFDDKDVKAQYQPSTPSIDSPHFEIKVYARPPRMISLIAEAYGAQAGYTTDYPTVLGTPFKVVQTGGDHFGTIGGLVMAKYDDLMPEIYGLSAGHVVPQDHTKAIDESIEGLEVYSGDDKNLACDDDGNINLDIVDGEYPFDFDVDLDLEPQSTERENNLTRCLKPGEWPDMCWSSIGNVVRMSSSNNPTSYVRNLDWSLIKFHDLLDYDPEILERLLIEADPSSQSSAGPVCALEIDLGVDKQVEVFGGKSGRKRGLLSSAMSRILLPPGEDFVRTYNLTLLDGTALQDGDCGSWVMDIDSAEVFGHVIASDCFGEMYVVPLCDTFEDIIAKLAANSVRIPSTKDILDWHIQRETVTDNIASQPKRSIVFADSGYSSSGTTPKILRNSLPRTGDGIISSFLHDSTKVQDDHRTGEATMPTSPAEVIEEAEDILLPMPIDQQGHADQAPTDRPTDNTTEVPARSPNSRAE